MQLQACEVVLSASRLAMMETHSGSKTHLGAAPLRPRSDSGRTNNAANELLCDQAAVSRKPVPNQQDIALDVAEQVFEILRGRGDRTVIRQSLQNGYRYCYISFHSMTSRILSGWPTNWELSGRPHLNWGIKLASLGFGMAGSRRFQRPP